MASVNTFAIASFHMPSSSKSVRWHLQVKVQLLSWWQTNSNALLQSFQILTPWLYVVFEELNNDLKGWRVLKTMGAPAESPKCWNNPPLIVQSRDWFEQKWAGARCKQKSKPEECSTPVTIDLTATVVRIATYSESCIQNVLQSITVFTSETFCSFWHNERSHRGQCIYESIPKGEDSWSIGLCLAERWRSAWMASTSSLFCSHVEPPKK